MKLSVHIFMHFNSNSSIPTYYINNKEICRKDETKDLGVVFNTDLCWDQYHRTIIARAYRYLYLLKRTFITHVVTSRKLLYTSLVRAQLTYCSQLWRPHLLKRHYFTRKSSTSCYKIHLERLSIQLQISSFYTMFTSTNVPI